MPIKPENKTRYPKNWPEIRERIRTRAGNKCEMCGVRNHSVGYRDEGGSFIALSGNHICEDYGTGIDPYTGGELQYKSAKEIADFNTMNDELGYKYIVIVCTVAHLDHTPENCSDENLKFLCQKCHNNYDVSHRRETKNISKFKNQLQLNL